MDKKIKIIADSSSDLLELEGADFQAVPLTISTSEREFVDDKNLNVKEMVEYLASYQGKSGTACPSVASWIDAFGDADIVYVVTITSNLSGSYNSAMTAKEMYLQSKPDAKVHVFDTLSAGAEVALVVDKIAELVNADKEYDAVIDEINKYMKKTRLFFSLESLHNLAQNGRVNKLVASAAGILGIRVFGTASTEGTLEQLSKCRNEKKVMMALLNELDKAGYKGGKCYVAHVFNEDFAKKLRDAICEKFGTIETKLYQMGGLCSFYAERGGVLMGFECE